MRVTLSQIQAEEAFAARNLAVARNKFEHQIEKYKRALREKVEKISAPYLELVERYFVENLIDRNGKPVLKGHIISDDGVSFYKVKDRLFSGDHKGNLTFAFITCSRIGQKKSKDVNISSDDLKYFEIKGKGADDENHN
jgi:hypothetical protein